MANGIPVRLSEALTVRARIAAEVQDRSLTEQVEHWARLGQAVEAVVSAGTVERLKARSHDEQLAERLAFAKSAEGRAMAAKRIRAENEIRYEATTPGTIVAVTREGTRTELAKREPNRVIVGRRTSARTSVRAVAGAGTVVKLTKRSKRR